MNKKNKSFIVKLLLVVTILSIIVTGCSKEETNLKNLNNDNNEISKDNDQASKDNTTNSNEEFKSIDISRLRGRLNLTEEQTEPAEKVFGELSEKQDKIMKELQKEDISNEDRQKNMDKNTQLLNDTKEKLSEILTEEQMEFYSQIMAKMGYN